jgi:hypothetical protein
MVELRNSLVFPLNQFFKVSHLPLQPLYNNSSILLLEVCADRLLTRILLSILLIQIRVLLSQVVDQLVSLLNKHLVLQQLSLLPGILICGFSLSYTIRVHISFGE